MMYRRPDTVSAAGIIVLAFALWGIVTWLMAISAPDSLAGGAQDAVSKVVHGLAAIGLLVAGPNILKGENWARWFYATLCAALLAYNLEFLRDHFYTLVPAAAIHVISLILLFLPSSNRYYASGAGRYD